MTGNENTIGNELYALAEKLFPYHRSIAGPGVRQTLDALEQYIPLERTEIPTGTEVFDWCIPQEWSITDAYIADSTGRRIVDYADSNLTVVNHSQPISTTMDWAELKHHVHTSETRPNAIPYLTGYFRDTWGFCVTQAQREALTKGGPWQIVINSEFKNGSLSLAECQIAGKSEETILLYAHSCHPSLANDNLSGLTIATYLAKWLAEEQRKYSYRIVFAPATIGAIAWLSQQTASDLRKIKSGLVLSLLGDSADFTFKKACVDDCEINHIVPVVLSSLDQPYREISFTPLGYDERQFASPGFQLPVGRLSRSDFGEFPEYHTSDDDLQLVTPVQLEQSFHACQSILRALEHNAYPINLRPFGEPNLGRHQLYRSYGERDDRGKLQEAIMWILNQATGTKDLAAISKRSSLSIFDLIDASEILEQQGLVELSATPKKLNPETILSPETSSQ